MTVSTTTTIVVTTTTVQLYYTVKRGDTLGKIAKAHGTTVAALVAANGIANPNALSIGDVLRTH